MAPRTFRVPVPLFSVVQHTYLILVLGVVGMGCPSSPGKKLLLITGKVIRLVACYT